MYPQCLDNLAGPGFLPERVGSLTREAHQEAVRDLVVNNKFLNKAWVNISYVEVEGKCYRGHFSSETGNAMRKFEFRFVFPG